MFRYLKYYIALCKNNFLAFVFVLIASTLVWGFMLPQSLLYYAILFCSSIYCIFNCKIFNFIGILVLLCCVLSLALNDVPPIFRAWERFALFALILVSVFPVFNSNKDTRFRFSLFQITYPIIVFIGVSSLICYLLNINLMLTSWGKIDDAINFNTAGWFSALTRHSMILAPLCAFSVVYLVSLIFKPDRSKRQKRIIVLSLFSCLCGLLLSASRIALAAAVVGSLSLIYLNYKGRINKFISVIIGSVIVLAAFYPLYGDFSERLVEKNESNLAKGSMFASREDRWNHRLEEWSQHPIFGMGFGAIDTKYTDEYSSGGIVETGSGWLAVLSMTGVAGAVCVAYLVLSTLARLYRRSRRDPQATLLFGLIMVFVVHLCAEGYIYAGGSFLCYLFWLTLGVGYTYSRADEDEAANLKFELI